MPTRATRVLLRHAQRGTKHWNTQRWLVLIGRVLCLIADGNGMNIAQALWTREGFNVTLSANGNPRRLLGGNRKHGSATEPITVAARWICGDAVSGERRSSRLAEDCSGAARRRQNHKSLCAGNLRSRGGLIGPKRSARLLPQTRRTAVTPSHESPRISLLVLRRRLEPYRPGRERTRGYFGAQPDRTLDRCEGSTYSLGAGY